MEEKELKTAKKPAKEKKEKLSYDELNNACLQLAEQNRKLYQEVQRLNATGMIKRLEFLFEVIKLRNNFSMEFVAKCSKEIEEALTIVPEETPEQPKEKE